MTSQIFANIYLHEFDRFVRHNLKPLAYVRYGDDFVLFCPTRRQAFQARCLAVEFLRAKLNLATNPKNDVIVPAKNGLKFLGHAIKDNFAVVDKHTTSNILNKVDTHNISSYRALPLTKEVRNRLGWILLEKHVDI